MYTVHINAYQYLEEQYTTEQSALNIVIPQCNALKFPVMNEPKEISNTICFFHLFLIIHF